MLEHEPASETVAERDASTFKLASAAFLQSQLPATRTADVWPRDRTTAVQSGVFAAAIPPAGAAAIPPASAAAETKCLC